MQERIQARRILALMALGALLALPILAQGSQSGTLTGTVRDTSGDPLPGVGVTATSDSLLGERTTVTAANGGYLLRGLPPGTYTLRFSLEGLNTVEKSALVSIGVSTDISIQMAVATVAETVVVTGEASNALETTTIGANYNYEDVDKLANPRNLSGIALLAPGVTANTPLAGQIQVAGGLAYDNVFLLDGVDINDSVFSQANNLFIEDAIEQVQVLGGSISAEYGRFTGGVVNGVTKSGGNDFHGTFRVDVTNPAWRDETPLDEQRGTKRIDDRNEVYSATLGGYLLRDKVWFFAAGRDSKTSTQNALALTGTTATSTQDNSRWELKLTGNINDSHRLAVTATDNSRDEFVPSSTNAATLDVYVNRSLPNDLLVGRYDGVITQNLFLEGQYSEKNFGFRNAGGTSTNIRDSPVRCWQTAQCLYNAPLFDANDPEDRNNKQLAAAASWFLTSQSAGSHDLRIGGESFKNLRTGGNNNSATDWVYFQDPVFDANGVPVTQNGHLIPNWQNNGLGVFFEAARGSEVSITTDTLYANDVWQLDDHWSFNLGLRYESVSSDVTSGVKPVDTDGIVPRIAATYDIKGNGKYIVDAGYAEYIGGYNLALFTKTTNTGNASYVYGFYTGPPGQGTDFAPPFDINNYFFVGGSIPTLNIFFDDNISAPTSKEYTVSFGYQLPRGGFLKATYQTRKLTDTVENFINIENGASTGTIGGFPITLDNQVFRNSNASFRKYEAVILQGRYEVVKNFTIQGSWQHELKNDGNYEGEGGASIGPGLAGVGDFPEVLDDRNHPVGHLNDYQADLVKLWGTYSLSFGRAGSLGLSLFYNYNSPLTYSLTAALPVTPEQAALDPGYTAFQGGTYNTYFGGRGTQEFKSWDVFNFAARYDIGLWKELDLWVKAEVYNVDNNRDQIFWNTGIVPDFSGPTDNLGRPTAYTEGPSFGNATSNLSYVTPREYRFSVGLRF